MAIAGQQLQQIIEAALLVSPEPLGVERLQALFVDEVPDAETLQTAIERLAEACSDRGYELVRVASGYRFQVRQTLAGWIGRLYAERPQRYSRALLETLSLIAYRQPVTRGDIEEVRGVAVSTTIMRTLLERGWIRVVGHREVPGRPAMYGTTREFLDYFNLRALDELPPLDRLVDPDRRAEALQMTLGLGGDDAASTGIESTAEATDGGGGQAFDLAPGSVSGKPPGAEADASQSVLADTLPDNVIVLGDRRE